MPRILFLRIAVLLLFISFLAYGNTLFNQFVWDDSYLIEQNPYLKDFKYIKKIFLSDVGEVMAHRQPLGFYRPLSMLSFMLDYKIWGLEPVGYHLTNILVHSLNSILLFMLFYYICKEIILSFLSALIFVVHPIHTEAVSAVFNRMGLLACLFMLISFIFYIRAGGQENSPGSFPSQGFPLWLKKITYLLASIVFFLLSLLSKETAIIFVFLLMSYDYYFAANCNTKMFFKRSHFYLLYFFVILPYFILRKSFINQELALGIWSNPVFLSIPFYLKILTTFKIIGSYIKLLIFPVNLSAVYVVTTAQLNFISIFYGALVLSLIILAYFLRKRNRLISFFVTFFFITILPFSLVIPFGVRFNDRFLYLPSVSFCFILGYFFKQLFSKSSKTLLEINKFRTLAISIILICIVYFYAYQTIKRNYDWRTDLSLWQAAVSISPHCPMAHGNLGYAYKDIQSYDKALEEFQKSLSLEPNGYRAYWGMGKVFLERGEFKKSLIYLKKAEELCGDNASIGNDIGIAYSCSGSFDMALAAFKKAIELWSDFAGPHYNIGMLYYYRDEWVEARYYFQKASDIDPNNQKFKHLLNIVDQKLVNKDK